MSVIFQYLWRDARSQSSTRTSLASSQESCPSPSRQITTRLGSRESRGRGSPPRPWVPRLAPFLWATASLHTNSLSSQPPPQLSPRPPLVLHQVPFPWDTTASPRLRTFSNLNRILKNRQLLRVLHQVLYPWGSFQAKRESRPARVILRCHLPSLHRETELLQSVVKTSQQSPPNKTLPGNHQQTWLLLLLRTSREKIQKVPRTERILRSM